MYIFLSTFFNSDIQSFKYIKRYKRNNGKSIRIKCKNFDITYARRIMTEYIDKYNINIMKSLAHYILRDNMLESLYPLFIKNDDYRYIKYTAKRLDYHDEIKNETFIEDIIINSYGNSTPHKEAFLSSINLLFRKHTLDYKLNVDIIRKDKFSIVEKAILKNNIPQTPFHVVYEYKNYEYIKYVLYYTPKKSAHFI